MRTKPSFIVNACPWCNSDHDPANQCREAPTSPRFQMQDKPKPRRRRIKTIADTTGKTIAVKHVYEEEEKL